MSKLLNFLLILLTISISSQAAIDPNPEEKAGASLGLQAARRLVWRTNNRLVPSAGYQASALAVKNSRKLQATKITQPRKKNLRVKTLNP